MLLNVYRRIFNYVIYVTYQSKVSASYEFPAAVKMAQKSEKLFETKVLGEAITHEYFWLWLTKDFSYDFNRK